MVFVIIIGFGVVYLRGGFLARQEVSKFCLSNFDSELRFNKSFVTIAGIRDIDKVY